jgi:hypothetical protein
MQLKVMTSLVAATSALLGSAPGPSIASEKLEKWKFDTSVAYYGESDRIEDASAKLLAVRNFKGSVLTLQGALDTLTGASANGAVPSNSVQTFTSPSGGESYTVRPGETPLDPTFQDTRYAVSANWLRPLGLRSELDLGGSVSSESDYFHAGVNARINRDFGQRNTRLTFGAAFAADSVDPEGGAPLPFATMLPAVEYDDDDDDDYGGGRSESKTVADLFLGVTRVLGKRTLGQLNYSLSVSSGYLNDPYKILSVLDPVTGEPVDGPPGLNLYLYESRPDDRTKHSLFGMIKHRFGRQVVDGSYRYMTDDWGIDSHTVDLHWRSPLGSGWYVQPHLRYYTQAAADFYRPYLLDGDPLPDHASADYRLGDLEGRTVGLKVGRSIGGGREYSARVEYYQQSGTSPPGASFGALEEFDLFPTVDALIVQLGYRF